MTPFPYFAQFNPADQKFWEGLLDRGLTIGFLAVAIYFVGKLWLRERMQNDALNAQIVKKLEERIDEQAEEMESIKGRIAECERDRADLRRKIEERT